MNQFQVISRDSEPRFGIEAEKTYQAYPFTFKDGVEGFEFFCEGKLLISKFKKSVLLRGGDWKIVGIG